ncbi:hypothetical protein [Thermoflexus sp.]|uniref:hypothetical protein n=1 Tax=Thermoflexus sp. TaxID=1969742 RepID=UPI0035E43EF2
MFTDPEIWTRLYHSERVAEARAEALRQEAAYGGGDETFWFQVGGWVIRLGRWMQESSAR